MRKIGIGIIGCGGIVNEKHIPCLLEEESVEIRALCDPMRPVEMKRTKDRFALSASRLYEDAQEMLRDEGVEAVHVCAPNQYHASLTIAALKAGKHVFCEKPMATNVLDAIEMRNEAQKAGKLLVICANHRFRADSRYLKQQCLQGAFGNIYYAKASVLRRRGVPTWGAFLSKAGNNGGAVMDVGVHALDLALWLLGENRPQTVFGFTTNRLGKRNSLANAYGDWNADQFEVEEFGTGLVTMENGATLYLEASWALNLRNETGVRVSLFGTEGGADMDDGLWLNGEKDGKLYNQQILLQPAQIAFHAVKEATPAQLEIHQWVQTLWGRCEPAVTPEQMITVMRVVEGLYQSAQSGVSVHLSE